MVETLEGAGAWWMAHLWAVSRQAALLILVVGVVAWVFRRSSPGFRYALWCIVLVRLCLPFGVSTPLGVEDRLRDAMVGALGREDAGSGEAATPRSASMGSQGRPERLSNTATVSSGGRKRHSLGSRGLAMAWLGIAGCAGVALLWRINRAKETLAACRVSDRTELQTLVDRLRSELDIGRRVQVRVSERESAAGPFVVGLRAPCIVLPARMAEGWSLADLEPVLLHELAHVKRHDLAVSALQMLLQIVYFFHPLVWLVNWRIRQLREEVCDDIAIHRLSGHQTAKERRRYARSFLRVIEESNAASGTAVCQVALAEQRTSLGRRVVRIMSKKYVHHKRLGVGALVGIAAIGIVAVCLTSESGLAIALSPRESLLQRAEGLYEDKAYREAIEKYEELYERYPDWNQASHALMMIGICHDWLGEQDEAITALERAVETFPDLKGWSHTNYFYLGLAYCHAGRDDEALEALQNCIRLCEGVRKPDEFPHKDALSISQHISAEKLYESGRYKEAIEAFERVHKEWPGNGDAANALMMVGICHDRLGEREKALAAFERAVSEYPDLVGWSETTYFYLGQSYEQAGRTQDALQAYTKSVSLAEQSKGRAPDTFPWRGAAERIATLSGKEG